MTPTDQEVDAVARVLALYVPDQIAHEAARAAIAALDQVRGK